MTALRQTWQVTLRYLRVIARQPAFLFIALVQPLIWLLLFGALFKAVTQIPGFKHGSYIDYLTPGIVVFGSPLLHVEITTRLVCRPSRLSLMSFENTTDWSQSPESSRNPE